MEIKLYNYKFNNEMIDLVVEDNKTTGITGDNYQDLIKLISLRKLGKGPLYVDNDKINKDNLFKYQRMISIVTKKLNYSPSLKTVNDLMNYTIRDNNLVIRDEYKKIKDSLKIVGLNDSYLIREINTLSNSEKKLIQISLSLLSNPDTLIIEEPTLYLDIRNEKKFIMLVQRLKEQFNKTIVFASKNSNMLYKYTDKMIFIKNNKIILEGKTEEAYLRVDYLKRNRIEIPEIVNFTYLAIKKKYVKIDYHTDVRDIIKDIYKHV